jgi:hypothetical protein
VAEFEGGGTGVVDAMILKSECNVIPSASNGASPEPHLARRVRSLQRSDSKEPLHYWHLWICNSGLGICRQPISFRIGRNARCARAAPAWPPAPTTAEGFPVKGEGAPSYERLAQSMAFFKTPAVRGCGGHAARLRFCFAAVNARNTHGAIT